jgi:hypothetical protein
MPLKKGKRPAVIRENIREMMGLADGARAALDPAGT